MRYLLILIFSLTLFSCSSNNQRDVDPARERSRAAKGQPAPSGTKLSKITKNMRDHEVRNIMGSPDDVISYPTGKSWIPWYFGPDTSRTDWLYKGKGRVVFSINGYSGGLKVIRVDYNPDELK